MIRIFFGFWKLHPLTLCQSPTLAIIKLTILIDTFTSHSHLYSTKPLAHSPRILAKLIRRGRTRPSTMSLVVVDQAVSVLPESKKAQSLPKVVTTPCDPWPRPYYLRDGLRRVLPYHFTYNTYCKERWRGREILDIFVSEFRDRPAEYYVRSQSDTDPHI